MECQVPDLHGARVGTTAKLTLKVGLYPALVGWDDDDDETKTVGT